MNKFMIFLLLVYCIVSTSCSSTKSVDDIDIKSIIKNNTLIPNKFVMRIISFSSRNLEEFSPYSSTINRIYSELYSNVTYTVYGEGKSESEFQYDCEVVDRRWNKVCILQHLMSLNVSNMDASQISDMYYIWMDIDMIIINYDTFQPEELISQYPNAHMIISNEYHMQSGVANTGCFIMKVSGFSRFLLYHWWNDYYHEIGHDQTFFSELVLALTSKCNECRSRHPMYELIENDVFNLEIDIHCSNRYVYDFVDYIAIVDGKRLNSYPLPVFKHQSESDAVLHLMGEKNEIRREIFKYAAQNLVATVQEIKLQNREISAKEFIQLLPPQFGLQRYKMMSIMIRTLYSLIDESRVFLSNVNTSSFRTDANVDMVHLLQRISDGRELIIQAQQYYEEENEEIESSLLKNLIFQNRNALYTSYKILMEWISKWKSVPISFQDEHHLQFLSSVLHTYAVFGNDLRIHEILVYHNCVSDIVENTMPASSTDPQCDVYLSRNSSNILSSHDTILYRRQLQYYASIQDALYDLWVVTEQQLRMGPVDMEPNYSLAINTMKLSSKMKHVEEMLSMHIHNRGMFEIQRLKLLTFPLDDLSVWSLIEILNSFISAAELSLYGCNATELMEIKNNSISNRLNSSLAIVQLTERLVKLLRGISVSSDELAMNDTFEISQLHAITNTDFYRVESILISIAQAYDKLNGFLCGQHCSSHYEGHVDKYAAKGRKLGDNCITTVDAILWFVQHLPLISTNITTRSLISVNILEILLYHHEIKSGWELSDDSTCVSIGDLSIKQNDLVYAHTLHISCEMLSKFLYNGMQAQVPLDVELLEILYRNIRRYAHIIGLLLVPSRSTLLQHYISMCRYHTMHHMLEEVDRVVQSAYDVMDRYCSGMPLGSCSDGLSRDMGVHSYEETMYSNGGVVESKKEVFIRNSKNTDFVSYDEEEFVDNSSFIELVDFEVRISQIQSLSGMLLAVDPNRMICSQLDNTPSISMRMDLDIKSILNSLSSNMTVLSSEYSMFTQALNNIVDNYADGSLTLGGYVSRTIQFIRKYVRANSVPNGVNDVVMLLSRHDICKNIVEEEVNGKQANSIELLLKYQLMVHQEQQVLQSRLYEQKKQIQGLIKNDSTVENTLILKYNEAIMSLNRYILSYYLKTLYSIVYFRFEYIFKHVENMYLKLDACSHVDSQQLITSSRYEISSEIQIFNRYYTALIQQFKLYSKKYPINILKIDVTGENNWIDLQLNDILSIYSKLMIVVCNRDIITLFNDVNYQQQCIDMESL